MYDCYEYVCTRFFVVVYFALNNYLEVELLGHKTDIHLVLKEIVYEYSKLFVPVDSPTCNRENCILFIQTLEQIENIPCFFLLLLLRSQLPIVLLSFILDFLFYLWLYLLSPLCL